MTIEGCLATIEVAISQASVDFSTLQDGIARIEAQLSQGREV
jgi:hypothetical protein